MHITSNSKSLLNEGRPNERKDEGYSGVTAEYPATGKLHS